jgi:putative Ca2+/H+ antiporter (TMEM165/GDT1 family)
MHQHIWPRGHGACGTAESETVEAVQGETNGIDNPFRSGGVGRWHCVEKLPDLDVFMEIFFASTLLVAVAEIGDKTMLLAILLATRFKKPMPVIAGIFTATIANHALAAWAGSTLASIFMSETFRFAVATGFLLMAAWTLIPDKVDDDIKVASQRGAFVATTIAFFFVEMGDKTQVATIALGAQYQAIWTVAAGTTLGMMIANVPAVYLGEQLVAKISLRTVHMIAAGMFLVLGLWQYWELSKPA